jgi:hypothetical protein
MKFSAKSIGMSVGPPRRRFAKSRAEFDPDEEGKRPIGT